jgi:hypothetical protein
MANGAIFEKGRIMGSSGQAVLPLLLRQAQPAQLPPVRYHYDPELEVNVIISPDGHVRPAVESEHAGLLTKTVSIVGEEQTPPPT